MTNILIADKHCAVRLGVELIVRNFLGDNCTIEFACNGAEILKKAGEKMYDIIITDLNMPGAKGIPLITKVLSINAKVRIVVLTANEEEYFAERCFQAGARAFIQKGAPSQEVETAVQAVIQGPFYISDKQKNIFATSLLLKQAFRKHFPDLSEKELEVALLLLNELDVIKIAYALGISIPTVKGCCGRIFKKLNVHNTVELAYVTHRCVNWKA